MDNEITDDKLPLQNESKQNGVLGGWGSFMAVNDLGSTIVKLLL